jgi:ABC-2 type transport system ATP-binding protein
MLVGAVSEVQHLYSDMTCSGYLRFFADLYGVDRAAARVAEMLADVGLADRAADRAVDLSKGLQQKLGLARALLHDPPVLILDEPVSGLDPHGIREVREIILRERGRGRLVFLSSHVLSEIERTADRVGIIRQGRLLYEGTVGDILARYTTLEDAFVAMTGEANPLAAALA